MLNSICPWISSELRLLSDWSFTRSTHTHAVSSGFFHHTKTWCTGSNKHFQLSLAVCHTIILCNIFLIKFISISCLYVWTSVFVEPCDGQERLLILTWPTIPTRKKWLLKMNRSQHGYRKTGWETLKFSQNKNFSGLNLAFKCPVLRNWIFEHVT